MSVLNIGNEEKKGASDGAAWGYTEEEWIFKQNLREFVDAEMAPRWREAYDENPEVHDAWYHEFMKNLGAMDCFRLYAPTEIGGLGMRLRAMLIAMEETARVCSGLATHVMGNATHVMSMARACPTAFAKYGEKILSGEYIIAGAMTSPEGCTNFAEQANIGVFDEASQEWVLNGTKAFCSGGTLSDVIRIAGLVDGTLHFFWIERDAPGLTTHFNREYGNSPYYASFAMDNLRLPKEMGARMPGVVNREIVSPVGPDVFAFSVASMALGAMEAAYDEAVEYLTHRTRYGAPILSMGQVQDQFSRMRAKIEACRSMILVGADLIEGGAPEAALYTNATKAFVCDIAREVTSDCVLKFGNPGVDADTGIGRHALDAIGLAIGAAVDDQHYSQMSHILGFPGARRVLP
jgi:alkylation response protein AidB-like acyl-CoA dehydrogenase